MLVEKVSGAVDASRPGQRGDGVDDKFEVALALAERLLGALLIVNVDVQGVPAHHVPIGVAKGHPANVKPAILSVGAEKSVYCVVRNPGRSRTRGRVPDVLQIFRVNESGEPGELQLIRSPPEVPCDMLVDSLDLTGR